MDRPWQSFSQIVGRNIGPRLKFPPIISSDEKLCIACSGGADSLCLLLALADRFPKNRLAVLHYNHNTRGKETDEDEHFVATIARALDLDFFSGKRESGSISEEGLRQTRYAFFSQTMAKINGRLLFLAHHGDDVIETMLMRLGRGSAEIAAPKYCQAFQDGTYRIRPLLAIAKQEIIDLFAQNQIPWREDPSNERQDYLRNRIRKIIPLFDHIFEKRNWKAGFFLSHRYLDEDATCLNQMAEALCTCPQKLDLQNVSHDAIIRRAIQIWLRDLPLSRSSFEHIFQAITKNHRTKINIRGQNFITLDHKILYRSQQSTKIFKIKFKNWQWGTLYLPTGYKLVREIVPFSQKNIPQKGLNDSTVYVDGKICANISLRSWHYGDQYRPINAPRKSLKRLFSEKKIPRDQRTSLPLLCNGDDTIIWVPHLPPADHAKVQNNFALKITFSST
ncbi:MAG: tRNA lysidine(34) synthetase TilS [Puniceicoccales bacterium]|jgi:tRNA(Ile)-lysidine synthase|nr:tRNA lysidine(34) synthetase TilS [Puniceicoccales bacterium]